MQKTMNSPYMLLVADVRPEKRRAMSESELALFAVMDKTRQEATLRQDYKHSFEAD